MFNFLFSKLQNIGIAILGPAGVFEQKPTL